MPEAIARVQRVAGALGDQVRGLRTDVDQLVAQLDRVNPQMATAIRNVEAYRTAIREGRDVGSGQHAAAGQQLRELAEAGGPGGVLARSYAASVLFPPVADAPPQTGPAPNQAVRPMAGPAPSSTGLGELGSAGRAIGENLRRMLVESVEQRGRLPSQEQNSAIGREFQRLVDGGMSPRAAITRVLADVDGGAAAEPAGDQAAQRSWRELGSEEAAPAGAPVATDRRTGKRYVLDDGGGAAAPADDEPVGPPRGGAPAGEPAPGGDQSADPGAGARDRRAPERPERTEEERDTRDRTQALNEQDETEYRIEQRRRAQTLSERGLRYEWQQTTRSIREQERELERTEERYRKVIRLRREKGAAPALDDELEDLAAKRRDLHHGMRLFRIERGALQDEAERRNYEVQGDTLYAPSGGGRGSKRAMVGAFLGGTGIGSGGIVGTAAGAAIGTLSPGMAVAGIAGLLIGKTIEIGKEAYRKYIEGLQATLPMGRMSGLPASTFMHAAFDETERYRLFSFQELTQSREQLMRGTGRADLSSVLPVAALTGQRPQDEVATLTALAQLSARANAQLSADLLRAYGGSAVAREHLGAGAGAALPFDTALYPTFTRQVSRLTQAGVSPFTRASPEGIAEQLGAASRRPMAGIDMSTAGGLDVAANLVQTLNQFTTRSTDAFGDMMMMGVLQLRKTATADRLRSEYGIDLNTPIGILRATQRAPELAANGLPEVQQAMLGAVERFMPNADQRALALTLGRGMDPESAYQLTRPGLDAVAGAARDKRVDPRLTNPAIDAAAEAMANRSDVRQVYEYAIRPDVQTMRTGEELVQELGAALTKGMNDIRDTVRDELARFFNSPGPDMMPTQLFGTEPAGPTIPLAQPW